MSTRRIAAPRVVVLLLGLALALSVVQVGAQKGAPKLDPIVYTITFPDPSTKTFRVEMNVPTENKASVDLMLPAWSPGYAGPQEFARQVSAFRAMTPSGTNLDVTQPAPNRWKVSSGGRPSIMIFYTLAAPRGSNLSSGVTATSAVIMGPSTYLTLVEQAQARRPAEVRLELPPTWKGSISGLTGSLDTHPNHYAAPDYDTLADSPILAGIDLDTTEFKVGSVAHHWAWLGKAEWESAKVAATLPPLLLEHGKFWGSLPFKKYAFLNIVTSGAPVTAIEHGTSVAINGSGKEPADPASRFTHALFLSHQYFRAVNGKRLRPVELGPFDYERPPSTTGLWIVEGLSTYYGDLLATRAAGSQDDFLALSSKRIADLQTKQPGRLVQTLEEASAKISEHVPANQKLDLAMKGAVVGLLLEAHIRTGSKGKKSLDDVMRTAYKRWSGVRGYSSDDFAQTAMDAAGFDLKTMLHTLTATTEELDYTEMLDWFGLRFAEVDAATKAADPAKAWVLEVRADATLDQQKNLTAFLAKSKG